MLVYRHTGMADDLMSGILLSPTAVIRRISGDLLSLFISFSFLFFFPLTLSEISLTLFDDERCLQLTWFECAW